MSEKELRELDTWIHRHIFEADLHVGIKKRGFWYRPDAKEYTSDQDEAGRYTRAEAKEHEYLHDDPVTIHEFEPKRYSANPAAAMELLKKCCKKAEEIEPSAFVSVGSFHQVFQVIMIYHNGETTKYNREAQAPTLELAICLFAKKLFTNPTP